MTAWAFTHRIAVRYGECDLQGVVFNATYLAYVDDCMDHWMRTFPEMVTEHRWDVMLKKATVRWAGPARWPEELTLECGVCRWGRTSFDVATHLRVGERPVADTLITYVTVSVGDNQPIVLDERWRQRLGPLVPAPAL